MFGNKSVADSSELKRIRALPRRTWTEEEAQRLADELTAILRTPTGTQTLRPIQAIALYEILTLGRLFGAIRVGGGKTLITLLASTVLGSRRAVLILPAALIEKTEADRAEYAKHWRVDRALRLLSYEFLGRINGAETLNQWQPDLILFDECHRVKNLKAAVTRRINRYFEAHPNTRALAMSGTILKHSLADFAHILYWTHKENAPIPPPGNELQEWCDALDEDSNPLNRMGVGALVTLADPKERLEENLLTCARKGFQRRLVETPGIVSTGGDKVDCSLYIESLTYDIQPITDENFRKLRDDWETPDGWPLFEPMQVWRHARELALGFHYVWDPRPPDMWLEPRKRYARFVRETLKRSEYLDSELQVRKAIIDGAIVDDENTYGKWAKVANTFEPNTKPVWHDDSAIKACIKWTKDGPGIIWTEHTFFGRRLAKELGVPYFGQKGTDENGNTIEGASGAIVASIAANSTGRNLQAWSRNLITSPPTGADAWEQLLGRTHRDGQKADTVTVDVLVGCREHLDALTRAIARAKMTRDTTGAEQKLLLVDLVIHKQVNNNSPRWTKTEGKEE